MSNKVPIIYYIFIIVPQLLDYELLEFNFLLMR